MPTWVVSGNCPTAWVCVLGSALLTAHLSLQHLLSSWSILSVKVVSPMLCLLVSLALLTICLYSKQNTISLCTRSTCSVLLGYSVDLCSLLCTEVWLLLQLVRETTETESQNYGYKFGQEEETYNIVAAHGYFGRLIFQYASFNNSRSCTSSSLPGCCWHLVHRSWCVHHGIQPERFQLQPVHH